MLSEALMQVLLVMLNTALLLDTGVAPNTREPPEAVIVAVPQDTEPVPAPTLPHAVPPAAVALP